ncbi:hypothetical protein BDW60DRAFT_118436 [Aspergillus nidulans var. acristatus]
MGEPIRWQPRSKALPPTSHRTTSRRVCIPSSLSTVCIYSSRVLGILLPFSVSTLDLGILSSVRPLSTVAERKTIKSKSRDDERQKKTPVFSVLEEGKNACLLCHTFTPFDTPKAPCPYHTYLAVPPILHLSPPSRLFWLTF